MILFPDPSTPRTTPLGNTEPVVNWYLQVTTPESAAARRAVNSWYDDFPDPRGALAARIRGADVDHFQALDELYVHHRLRATVDDVRYEEGGVGPDFRLYRSGALVGAVEVASLFMRDDWARESRGHGALADEVNRRLSPGAGWFVDLELVRIERTPSVTKLVAFLNAELRRLPPPGPAARVMLGPGVGFERLPSARFTAAGVEILARFLPMAPGASAMSDPDARIIGAGPTIGGMVNSADRLRERVVKKGGGRYSIGEVPLLIAVGLHDTFCSEDQVVIGLYGGEDFAFEGGGRGARQPCVFGDGTENRRIAAVATWRLRPWDNPPAELTLWDHPEPRAAWPDDLIACERRLTFPQRHRGVWRK